MSRSPMIEDELAVRLPTHAILSTPVTDEAVKFYVSKGKDIKDQIDVLAAEVKQRQEKIKFIHEIIQEINNSINTKDGSLDISKNSDLQEKLLLAKKMDINIPMDGKSTAEKPCCKSKFTSDERERLLQNLGLSTDAWDKENKQQTQKMQILMDESNRYLTLATQIMKYEDKPKRASLSGMSR